MAALCLVSSPTAAATLDYYYVGSPYRVSNYVGADRPLFTMGHVRIDESRLPGGDLAGRSVVAAMSEDYTRVWPEAVAEVTFWNARDSMNLGFEGSFVRSDGRKRLADWHLADVGFYSDPDFYHEVSRETGDWAGGYRGKWMPWLGPVDEWGEHDVFDNEGYVRHFLVDRGYEEGSRAFAEKANDPTLWRYAYHTSQAGMWFDNLIDFTDQVVANTRYAAANPPRSIYDIAPVPLPLPLLLLAAGFAALATLPRRRAMAVV